MITVGDMWIHPPVKVVDTLVSKARRLAKKGNTEKAIMVLIAALEREIKRRRVADAKLEAALKREAKIMEEYGIEIERNDIILRGRGTRSEHRSISKNW
jgi:hypothetical protein